MSKPPPEAKVAPAVDTRFRALDTDDIKLTMVGDVAYLDGHVSSYQQKKAISHVAADLPRVRKLVNRLRVVPCSPTSDRIIVENVFLALRTDPALRLHPIAVTVTDGIVELSGAVPDFSARIAAEAAAWSVCGVRHVINRLEIAPAGEAYTELRTSLRRGLSSLLGPYTDSVEIDLRQGFAYLRGAVPTLEDRLAVEDMVRWHPLVRDVINQLTVQEPDPLSTLAPSA